MQALSQLFPSPTAMGQAQRTTVSEAPRARTKDPEQLYPDLQGLAALSSQNQAAIKPSFTLTRLTFSGGAPKTEVVNGSDGPCPFGPEYEKYWQKLPNISWYFREMTFDAEALLSIKPIKYFYHLGRSLPRSIQTIVDPFCGGGGASIGLAKAGFDVQASDLNPQRVNIAEHNAGIFRVHDDISFKQADALQVIREAKADCVYLDPPWGAFDRKRGEPFRLENLGDFGQQLLSTAMERFPHVLLSIPKDIDLNELKQFGRDFSVYNGTIAGKNEFTTIYFHPTHD